MAQLMPLPLTVSCFSNIQIVFTFLVRAHPGSPGQRAIKRVCVCVCGWLGSQVVSVGLRRSRAWVQITASTLSGNSLRQTVHTHRASVHQASKLLQG